MSDPAVTVVITCFNYGHWLPESVGSVLEQTFSEFELIIVDDGSTDDSLAVARRLAAGDERITVITQPNSGQPAIPRNLATARQLELDRHPQRRFKFQDASTVRDHGAGEYDLSILSFFHRKYRQCLGAMLRQTTQQAQ